MILREAIYLVRPVNLSLAPLSMYVLHRWTNGLLGCCRYGCRLLHTQINASPLISQKNEIKYTYHKCDVTNLIISKLILRSLSVYNPAVHDDVFKQCFYEHFSFKSRNFPFFYAAHNKSVFCMPHITSSLLFVGCSGCGMITFITIWHRIAWNVGQVVIFKLLLYYETFSSAAWWYVSLNGRVAAGLRCRNSSAAAQLAALLTLLAARTSVAPAAGSNWLRHAYSWETLNTIMRFPWAAVSRAAISGK